ncbi:hypothetical protein EVAR_48705_1 [Eumeta japonica]|uniref:Uncharacterized protein n=1 Tax=Eumeta variegata TaxID=151549 RepID=A0A4C1XAP1_EUMVA|nr:hypothetical protein EVAR_48705_1 [Eumeta japonica]
MMSRLRLSYHVHFKDKQESLKKMSSPVKEGKLGCGSNIVEECIQPSRQIQEVQGKITTEICKNKVANNDACAFDPDLEVSSEPAFSVDTGCGSSLAYSDIEKGFFSSEYSESNSPLSIDTLMMRKEVTKAVSVATSPITVLCSQDVGTDPIKFFDYKSVGIQHDTNSKELNFDRTYKEIDVQCDILSKQQCRNVEVQCELKPINKEIKTVSTQCDIMSDKISIDVNRYLDVATQSDFLLEDVRKPESDKSSLTPNVIKSPNEKCKRFEKKQHKIDKQKTLPLIAEEELNQDDIDTEVTTILNEMRLGFGKITPIPLSPVPNSNKNNTVPHLESDHQQLSSQLLVLNKTVMAIANALKVHGINISNVNENIMVDAKDSLNDKSMSNEKNTTKEFDNNFDICTEKTKPKQHSQKNCNSVNENGKKPENISEKNLEHSSSYEQQENETVVMENTLGCVNSESLSFSKEVKDDQNNCNKVYEKERKRGIKKRKITKLQKIRKNVLPKYKIKKELPLLPQNKSSNIPNRKSFIHKEPNKKLKSIEILNNKAAYEKALRVVAEMRQKEKDTLAKKYGKTIFLKPNAKKKVTLVPSKQLQCSDVQSKRLVDNISPNRQEDRSYQTSNNSWTSPILTKSFKQSILNGNNLLQISKKNVEISEINANIKKHNTDVSQRDRNVSDSECLEDVEPVNKQEVRKYANLKNKKEMIKNIYMELDSNIEEIINLKNTEVNGALKKFAESMQDVNIKHLVAAIITVLQSPKKAEDVICKTCTPPAPPMAKSEQILLYLLKHLNSYHDDVNLFDMMMDSIAYKLFKLNNLTPSFEEVESLSHFYAVLCRYTSAKNKLRLFILDAMYCLSYKAIPVIKQCLDVWMHILPLAHMGLAKSPLVVTLVYLLHFYRCDDQSGRVQNIRMLLRKRYSYDMGDWNETKILEMFKDAITHLREIPIEKKMLRTSLILIAKRNGVEWCQKNIVKKLLLPIIENETASKTVRAFCVSLLGAVMRPYPKHMRLHCEIVVNQLFVMLEQEESPQFQEALFTSLIYLSKHSLNQVVTTLLAWKPLKVSPVLEELLKDFVQEKSLKTWHYILSQNAKQ